ncbi:MAG: tripartite tricarboxylate transporter substrate binding protein [Pseudomonadota bacterium]
MFKQINTSAWLAAALLAAAFTPFAGAQTFPTKTVKIITPFSAGSGPDAALRVIAEKLSQKWGQAVIVDNRPGGNGFVAMGAFKQTMPGGHDLIALDSNHMTTHPHTFRKLPYDPQRDLEPIRPILRTDFFVVVGKDSPFQTLNDIINAAKSRPGAVVYGSWFVGSPGHLGALRLQSLKGIQMMHVPYKDMGQLYTAVATKEVQWALGSVASAGGMEKAGRVRFISLGAAQRSPLYPNVPTTGESPGTKGYEVNAWVGLFAPRGTPELVRNKINADVAEAMASPELIERYRTLGYQNMDLGPDQFAKLIRLETQAWKKTIDDAGLKLDD